MLDNDNWIHLVLASGKLVLQKNISLLLQKSINEATQRLLSRCFYLANYLSIAKIIPFIGAVVLPHLLQKSRFYSSDYSFVSRPVL